MNAPIEPLLTVPEAAAVLRISRTGMYRLLASGVLPVVRLVGCVRIRPADLAALIDESTQQTHSGGEARDDSTPTG